MFLPIVISFIAGVDLCIFMDRHWLDIYMLLLLIVIVDFADYRCSIVVDGLLIYVLGSFGFRFTHF